MIDDGPTKPDFSAPVIIVGPGRSGTTLLDAALGEHPDMYMIGETQFLVQRVWKTLWEFPGLVTYKSATKIAQQTRPEWKSLLWYTFWREVAVPENKSSQVRTLLTEVERAEYVRIARELGASFARMLIPPPLRRRHWGMKEIWIGSDGFQYSLDFYELAFPNARYLHSVRNPLTYLASNFNNKNVVATDDAAIHELKQWVQMTRYARTLADTERYMEFRHEDFVGDGGRTAESVFAFVGLDLSQQCRRSLQVRHLPSCGPNSFLPRADAFCRVVPGLREEMEKLGYLGRTGEVGIRRSD